MLTDTAWQVSLVQLFYELSSLICGAILQSTACQVRKLDLSEQDSGVCLRLSNFHLQQSASMVVSIRIVSPTTHANDVEAYRQRTFWPFCSRFGE